MKRRISLSKTFKERIMSLIRTPRDGSLFLQHARRAVCLASALVLTSSAASAGVFLVNSNADTTDNASGNGICSTGNIIIISTVPLLFATECTLRAAISESNGNPGQDTIEFSSILPTVAGVVEFTPALSYPAIQDSVIIDGYSHPSYDDADPAATPIINLRGTSTSGFASGLRFLPGSDNSVVNGLAISGFPGHGIELSGFIVTGPANIRIQGNHIGIWRGVFYTGNGLSGVRIALVDNSIIGQVCGAFSGCSGKRNVIAANANHGVYISNGNGNRIAGNYIGVTTTGTSTFVPFGGSSPNGENGVFVDAISTGNIIGGIGSSFAPGGGLITVAAGNLISGNTLSGINIQGAGNTVIANMIGTNAAGTSTLGNQGSGIFVGGDDTVIGGTGLRGNLISGNGSSGISVDTDTGGDPFRLSILNNRIGVNATADAPLGNGNHGMLLWGGDHEINDNIIGGNSAHGISDTSNGSIMLGNYIGTNENGENLGNSGVGLIMSEGNQTIGGVGAGNVIGFNAAGIVGGGSSYNNHLYANYIGTNPAGDDLGNLGDGINIVGPEYEVGLTNARTLGLANTIGFNGGHGIVDTGFATSIQGNYVGTDASGADLGNAGAGIHAETIAGPDAGIGATLATLDANVNGAGNIVGYNLQGIVVDNTSDLPVRGNQLIGNDGPGLDLEGDGPTANDLLDPDTGANERQNTPVFNTAQTFFNPGTGELQVRFGVSSAVANAAYPLTVDFYIHDPWLNAGDQARAHLGSVPYDALDAGSFVTTTITPTPGTFVPNSFGDLFGGLRATATDAQGNTSELSRGNVPVPEPGSAAMLTAGLLWLIGFARRGHRSLV